MAGHGLHGLRGSFWLVAALTPLVPAARRRVWTEQWRAELWHYAQWLQREHGRVSLPDSSRAPPAPRRTPSTFVSLSGVRA